MPRNHTTNPTSTNKSATSDELLQKLVYVPKNGPTELDILIEIALKKKKPAIAAAPIPVEVALK